MPAGADAAGRPTLAFVNLYSPRAPLRALAGYPRPFAAEPARRFERGVGGEARPAARTWMSAQLSRALRSRRLAFAAIAGRVDAEDDAARLALREALAAAFSARIAAAVAGLPAQDTTLAAAALG